MASAGRRPCPGSAGPCPGCLWMGLLKGVGFRVQGLGFKGSEFRF